MFHQNADIESIRSEVIEIFFSHYRDQKKEVRVIDSGTLGVEGQEGSCLYVSFIIERSILLRYTIPNAPRTFGGLWIGVGPEYVPVEWIFDFDIGLATDVSNFSIKRNLDLLDRYINQFALRSISMRNAL